MDGETNNIKGKSACTTRICSITNQYAFPYVMGKGHEDNCRDLLQRIFPNKKILEIKIANLSGEATIINKANSKNVRLDVLFQGETEWFDIEMQISNEDDIRKRSRYYHSSMDMLDLASGDIYSALKPHYVIFICTFDLFEKGEAIYSFRQFDEKNHLSLDDGCYTLILNLKCDEEKIPEMLKTFYDYANRKTVDENDEFISRLHSDLVEFSGTEEGLSTMTFEEDLKVKVYYARENGLKEGKEQGIKEGNEQGKLFVLFDLVRDGLISKSQAATKAGITEEQFDSLMSEAGF